MEDLQYIFFVLIFLTAVLLVEGLYLAWNSYKGPEAKAVKKRLLAMSANGSSTNSIILKKRLLAETAGLEKFLLKIPRVHKLDKILLQSGLSLSVAKFLGITSLIAIIVAIVGSQLISLPIIAVVGISLASGGLVFLYVSNKKNVRITKIEQQLPDALDLMARGMMAGHAFPSALQMIGNEMPDPIASEFRIVFDEINYGIPIKEALSSLIDRVPSTDLSYFVTAVLIQRETGGNLAELLGNISRLVRSRLQLLGTVRVLSAEGRLSAWILTLLPFFLGMALYLMNPNFLSVLWKDEMGIKMVGGTFSLMIVGIFAMWRITKIRV
ncbi:MAG: type II secretion system F family protein [Methylophilaceae bacterium]|jgi:tight adherence protein B